MQNDIKPTLYEVETTQAALKQNIAQSVKLINKAERAIERYRNSVDQPEPEK